MSTSDNYDLFAILDPVELAEDESRSNSLLQRTKRGKKPLFPPSELISQDDREQKGLDLWAHYHFEREYPLDYRFAAIVPQLGRMILKTVYAMSGPHDIIASGSTAQSYRAYLAPFFVWLQQEATFIEGGLGQQDCVLQPEIFKLFKKHIDDRVEAGSLQSKTGYQYKGALTRVLHRIWLSDKSILGPRWQEKFFLLEDFDDDTKQREPYSAAEARRILDACIKVLSEAVADDSIHDPTNYLVEIAIYTAVSLMIGIESECIDALKVGDVKPSPHGKVMMVTYQKRRSRKRGSRTRLTDPYDPASGEGTRTEEIGSFRTAGGLFALMLRRAKALEKEPEDPLWLRRLAASEFRRLTSILRDRGLRCDLGRELKIDRTKFRVSHKTAKMVRSKGKIGIYEEDNSRDVNARHYLESDRMKPHYEAAIENAGLEALKYALEGCKAVDLPDDAPPEAIATVAAELDVPVEQIRAALTGETDLWLSSCRSFYNSPFDAPGKPCSKSFFKCLGCGNALVTRRTLPRVIRFLHHIVEKRATMSDTDWRLKFGESHTQITREVLPRFPDAIVAEARVIAQGIGADILILPELLA